MTSSADGKVTGMTAAARIAEIVRRGREKALRPVPPEGAPSPPRPFSEVEDDQDAGPGEGREVGG